ncbi:MAG TPA: tRNA preQ1(34) S-adenosylmethionine ribosyltransferase-isomerase QueA [Candidatus Polarisedimenticolia bacterium]|nr:tRNA preQ1(34) S-adenosylmethionine ribosyltransferase-isomerase QueA [Candidatus Polarisedimenticolia bacterium]
MRLDEFDYRLPQQLIAQEPRARRDDSRLLLLDRALPGVTESTFDRLGDYLRPGDLLVLNETRVRAARFSARKATGGRVDILQIDPRRDDPDGATWNCMMTSSQGLRPGARLIIADDLHAELLGNPVEGRVALRFFSPGGPPGPALRRHGRMPLPPYIRRQEGDRRDGLDRERYQTVYAGAVEGAVAAPTAGLHFTRELLQRLEKGGTRVAALTLHVGPGTFQPVRVDDIEGHRVEPEYYVLPPDTAQAVRECRRSGGRVIAVGTTVTRVLEACAADRDEVRPGRGWCDLYIRPGHRFRTVDALLTNLHLPRSSLLILVAAFAGRDRILAAYAEAIRRGFRFYSYGDAMLIQ